jgi:hypothetical protein
MTTITHKIRDNISQGSYDAQRQGVAVPLGKDLGYFEQWGQYLLALNMLKDAAMVAAHNPGSQAAADEIAWLGDEQETLLPASRCFEVLGDLLNVPDPVHFRLAFIDAIKRDADAMYRALRSLQVSLEGGRPSADASSMSFNDGGRAERLEVTAEPDEPELLLIEELGLKRPAFAASWAERARLAASWAARPNELTEASDDLSDDGEIAESAGEEHVSGPEPERAR